MPGGKPMRHATSAAQQRFMGAELERKREGKATETGMSEEQLHEFASAKASKLPEHKKPPEHHGRHKTSEHAPHGRKPSPRGGY